MPRCVAAALCLALLTSCTSDQGAAPDPALPGSPGGSTADGQGTTIQQLDFQVTYRLEGITGTSSSVSLLPNAELTLTSPPRDGTQVAAGQALGSIEVDPAVRDRLAGGDPADVDRSRLAQLEALAGPLTSPVDGVFSSGDGQPRIVGDGIDVLVDLTPIQYLRYRSFQFTGQASVETVIGVRQVPCAAVWVGSSTDDEGLSVARLHCRLPRLVETVAGLRARVTLVSSLIEDAVVVLNSYIGYDTANDSYFLTALVDGAEQRIPIVVGATDGVRRVVLTEVPIGAALVRPPEAAVND
jgi:hypothetical protein